MQSDLHPYSLFAIMICNYEGICCCLNWPHDDIEDLNKPQSMLFWDILNIWMQNKRINMDLRMFRMWLFTYVVFSCKWQWATSSLLLIFQTKSPGSLRAINLARQKVWQLRALRNTFKPSSPLLDHMCSGRRKQHRDCDVSLSLVHSFIKIFYRRMDWS